MTELILILSSALLGALLTLTAAILWWVRGARPVKRMSEGEYAGTWQDVLDDAARWRAEDDERLAANITKAKELYRKEMK